MIGWWMLDNLNLQAGAVLGRAVGLEGRRCYFAAGTAAVEQPLTDAFSRALQLFWRQYTTIILVAAVSPLRLQVTIGLAYNVESLCRGVMTP